MTFYYFIYLFILECKFKIVVKHSDKVSTIGLRIIGSEVDKTPILNDVMKHKTMSHFSDFDIFAIYVL